jgi:arginine N-succinyltransferase
MAQRGQRLSAVEIALLFMAAFRERFNEKVVAEMRGVIDEHGYSPFWESWETLLRDGVLPRRLPVRHRAEGVYCRADAEASAVYRFLSDEAQAVIGEVHPQTAPARAVLEKEGFRYLNYVDIFDGGPTLECEIDRVRAIRKSRLVTVVEGQPAPGEWPACLVANEQYQQFRAMLVHADPESDRWC